MTHYTLNELEKITGISAATIRVWERRHNAIIAKRTGTNRRWYDDNDLRKLMNISVLQESGIKISKIAEYSEDELIEKVECLKNDSPTVDSSITSLIKAMLSFNSNAVNEILLRSVINVGFEDTFNKVVFPFLTKIGIMWHTGSANTGSEHFITNIIRGKLISATDCLPPANDTNRKRVIMFLPDNELHEIGLLYYAYLIRKMGHEVLYLGQATPLSALIEANEKWHSDIIITGVLTELSVFEPAEYLKILSSTFKTQKILLSGSLADQAYTDKYKNTYPVKSVSDLKIHF